jgi:hypothetical protein
VTGAQLLSQTGSGGATPNFELSFDADTSTKPATNHGNCFGSFNFGLDLQGIHGGIANPNATIFGGPAGSWVVGPVTFDIQLTGPEVANLTSDTFASATSSNGGQRETNVFVKWQAGVNGESIELGNNQECLTSVYIRGEPRIGNTIQVCAGGSNGCHACIQFSAYPGPTMFMGYVVEIGLPLMGSIDLGSFSGGITELCVPIRIPNRPVLIGQHFYFVNAGTLPSNPSILVFSPGYEIVILP